MKILFLNHPEQDYLQEMIFSGLCNLIGEENIYLYPMLKRFKDNKTPDDWYILDSGKIGFTSPAPYMIPHLNLPELSLEDICNNIDLFDYIIFFPRTYSIQSLSCIKYKYPDISSKLIMIDGEDGDNLRTDLIKEFSPRIIFKRELLQDIIYHGQKIYPLPFAAFTDKLKEFDKSENKNIDLFGLFGNTHPLRLKLINKIIDMEKHGNFMIDIDTGADHWDRNLPRPGKREYKEYMQMISRSKIGLSVRGHGRDTVRMWEVVSFKTLMFIIDPGIIIPSPFKHKENAIFIKEDLSNFEEELKYYLSHDKEREEIAEAGHEHLMKFHTCKERTRYMLDIIEGGIR